MDSLTDRLAGAPDAIIEEMDSLLDASSIKHDPDQFSRYAREGILVLGLHDSAWEPIDENQGHAQRRVLELWNPWIEPDAASIPTAGLLEENPQ